MAHGHAQLRIHRHTYIHRYIHTYIGTYICMCICTIMHSHARTYTCTVQYTRDLVTHTHLVSVVFGFSYEAAHVSASLSRQCHAGSPLAPVVCCCRCWLMVVPHPPFSPPPARLQSLCCQETYEIAVDCLCWLLLRCCCASRSAPDWVGSSSYQGS